MSTDHINDTKTLLAFALKSLLLLYVSVFLCLASDAVGDLVVLEGKSVILRCGELSANTSREVNWCKRTKHDDCKEVLDSIGITPLITPPWNPTDVHLVLDSSRNLTSSLNITSVSYSRDHGIWKCTSGGTAEEANATGVVPLLSLTLSAPQMIPENSNITLLCEAVGGIPTPQIFWEVPESVEETEVAFVNQTTKISFAVTKDKHGTEIKCKTVKKHYVVKTNLTLNITYKPRVSIQTIPTPYVLGEEVKLVCAADGNPIHKTFWTVDEKPLQTRKGQNVYRIKSLQTSHAGIYECTAKNIAGNTTDFSILSTNNMKSTFWYNQWQYLLVAFVGLAVLTAISSIVLYRGCICMRLATKLECTRELPDVQQAPSVPMVLQGRYAAAWFNTPTQANSEIRRSEEPTVYAAIDFRATANH